MLCLMDITFDNGIVAIWDENKSLSLTYYIKTFIWSLFPPHCWLIECSCIFASDLACYHVYDKFLIRASCSHVFSGDHNAIFIQISCFFKKHQHQNALFSINTCDPICAPIFRGQVNLTYLYHEYTAKLGGEISVLGVDPRGTLLPWNYDKWLRF